MADDHDEYSSGQEDIARQMRLARMRQQKHGVMDGGDDGLNNGEDGDQDMI